MPASKTRACRSLHGISGDSKGFNAPPQQIARDRRLHLALKHDAPEAIELLFRTYGDEMRQIALSITGSPADADDVVQDIFLRLPRVIGSFEGRASIRCWLRRVSRRQALQQMRAQRRQRETIRHFSAQFQTPIARPLDRIALERAVTALPKHYREVIVLRHVYGLTHCEIARSLGITANLSGVRLFRAQALLREALCEL